MTIKAFDTSIVFTDTLTLSGAPFDLTGCTALFVMRNNNGGPVFSAAATINPDQVNQKGGISYQPTTNFPTSIANYWQEWSVTVPGGKLITFPGDTYNQVRIIEDLTHG